MEFIKTSSPDKGVEQLARTIADRLEKERKAVWLVTGGSNIPLCVRVMDTVRGMVTDQNLFGNLAIMLTDERYGEVGHADSNWQKLIDTGFDFDNVKKIPVVVGLPMDATVERYEDEFRKIFEEADVIIAQFGIGADGHIAGVLPHSPAVNSEKFVVGYDGGTFKRITLTPKALVKIDIAYAFVFGGLKTESMKKLQNVSVPLDEQPAQILKQIPEAFVFTDQLS